MQELGNAKNEILKNYYGFSDFREGQEEIIDNILQGRDTIAICSTGAGKSLCFQLPALIMEGITLVISPLISLMRDQVKALNDMGVHAAYLNSSLTYVQYQKALEYAKQYKYKLIYVAPERLTTAEFLDFALNVNISMISVDEAHCISQWGQNFRPSYLKILEFINQLPTRPIISCFTATATWQVRLDIIDIMHLKDPAIVITGFNRKNLYFEVRKPKNKYDETRLLLQSFQGKSGIIYCLTRKEVEDVCQRLYSEGYSVTRYHAGLSDAERRRNQDDFVYDRIAIMVATNAFGMGIDKPNVNFVIHYNMPKDLESYYQEAGRAGRDGEPAQCVLLYAGKDVVTNQFFIDHNEENGELDMDMRLFIQEKDRKRLRRMTFYCFTNDCLRDYILRYFNEYGGNYCANCSNCLTKFKETDVTEQAKAILGCIWSVRQRYGINVILDTLRGSKAVKVRQYRLDSNEYYGKLSSDKDYYLRLILNHLMLNEYVILTDEQYPILKLTAKAKEILQDETTVIMKVPEEEKREAKSGSKKGKDAKKKWQQSWGEEEKPGEEELFEEFRELRRNIASKQQVPPYIVFNDKTLREMAHYQPHTQEEMLQISGVGSMKFEKYGEQFLTVIRNFKSTNAT